MASNHQEAKEEQKWYTIETSYVIFLKKFSEFLPPKPDRKYSHTNSYIFAVTAITQHDPRSHRELGMPVP